MDITDRRLDPLPAAGKLRFVNDEGVARILDSNGRRARVRPEAGTPVNGVAATATIDPTGVNNSVIFTSKQAGPSRISVGYATPADTAITAVSVDGDAVTVTPGTKARITVAGTLNDGAESVVFSEMFSIPTAAVARWSSVDGVFTPPASGAFYRMYSNKAFGVSAAILKLEAYLDGVLLATWSSGTGGGYPTEFSPVLPATGAATVTYLTSSAAQVIAAVNADTSNPVTASASGTVTGAVAAVAATLLTGGDYATPAIAGDQMFDDTNIYQALADITISSTSGWRKVAHSAL